MLPLRGAAAVACKWRQTNRSSLTSSINHHNLELKFPSCSPQTRTWLRIHQSGVICQIRAVSEAKSEPIPIEKRDKEQSPGNWKIKMLYDGDCPLCMREVNMLRERNKSYGTIKFIDISSQDYCPLENHGLDYKTVMGRIHAILSDGTVVTDVEAFRRLYEHVGLGWVYAITKYQPIASIADAIYGVWAKYRLQITGRPPIEEIMQTRKLKNAKFSSEKSGGIYFYIAGVCCVDGSDDSDAVTFEQLIVLGPSGTRVSLTMLLAG